MALMILEGMPFDFTLFAGLIFMLAIAMVAAPGVPGGAIMAAIGILQSMLGFNEEMIGLMIALYIAMDSFGTACNVTGDGAIALVVGYGSDRRVDRDLMEIGPTQSADLRIDIRMNAAGQERVIGEIDSGHDVRHAKGYLLRLRKEVIGVAIEHHAANDLNWNEFLWHEFGRIQKVEAPVFGILFSENLQAQFPLRILGCFNRLPQVAPMKIRICTRNFDGLIPYQRVGSKLGFPMELDEFRFAVRIDQTIRVHSKAFHHAVAARNRAVTHLPYEHVG